ncbi:MAG: LuxR C-terminal-related transcriptional regulator [Marmoricola sp.]
MSSPRNARTAARTTKRPPSQRVSSVLGRCRGGTGSLTAVVAPAGMGKSTLLAEAAGLAEDFGIRHLATRGDVLVRSVPYAGVRELFSGVIAAATAEELAEIGAGAAALALPVLDARYDGATPTVESRAATLHGLYWWTANLAARGPLLLTVDDAHLLDAETLDWLAYLQTRVEGMSVAVMIASRPTNPGELVDTLVSSTPPEALIVPAPMTLEEVDQVARAAGVELDADTLQGVYAATGGMPFLVRAAVAAVDETHAWPIDLDEAALTRSIVERITATTPHALQVAQAIVILGPDAAEHLVARVTGLPIGDVLEATEALQRARLLAVPPPLVFVHELVGNAIDTSIGARLRQTLHVAAADLLAAQGAGIDRVVAHLLDTEPADEPRHRRWLQQAVDLAERHGAPRTAAEYLHRLLKESLDPAERAAALHRLGRCGVEIGAADTTAHLFAAVSLTADPCGRLAVMNDLAKALILEGRLDEAFRALLEVSDSLGSDSAGALELRAEALGLGMLNVVGDDVLRPLARHVADRLQWNDQPADRRAAAALSFERFRRCAPAEECARLATYALGGAASNPTELALSPAYLVAQIAHLYSGRVEDARALARDGQRWASERGAPALYFACGFQAADVAAYEGDLATIEAFGRDVQQAFDDGLAPLLAAATALPLDVWGMLERGRRDEAHALLAGYGVLDLPSETLLFSGQLLVRGLVHLSSGDADLALADFEVCGQRQAMTGHSNAAAVPWRRAAVDALIMLGRCEEALVLADEDLSCARRFGEARAVGFALNTRARVPSNPYAEADLGEAVAVLGDTSARLEQARALIGWGGALRRRGQRRDAREPLRHGRELAERCGAVPLAVEAERELRATGAYLVGRPVSGICSLTASERRVVECAMKGLTNAQIAQSLFVSLKTVEMHLSRSYQKLGIRRRDELAALFAEANRSQQN